MRYDLRFHGLILALECLATTLIVRVIVDSSIAMILLRSSTTSLNTLYPGARIKESRQNSKQSQVATRTHFMVR